ncbi:MarR family winged helix-turn-helix transcriptional regulator [Microbacterium sp. E-13]|uniref:MarR family winged helix-turn-helix transcriptional regulator n=1 Tax=Microbacterium sp. E-13 TaxID=3404048 RepID=UPI003CF5E599
MAVTPQEMTALYRRYLTSVVLFHQRAASIAGIGMTDYQASNLLALQRSMSAGELGAALGLTSGATTRLIDRMVDAGYARRVYDTEDRRRVIVEHTGKMESALQEQLDRVRGPIGETIASLDPHQLEGLVTYLQTAATAYESAGREAV